VSNISRVLDSVRTTPDLFLQIPEGAAEVKLNEARGEAVRLTVIFSTPFGTGYDDRLTRTVLARDFSGINNSAGMKKVIAEVKKAGGLAGEFRALAVSIDKLMDTSERRVTRPGNPINVRLMNLRDMLNELGHAVQQAAAAAA